MVSVTEYSKQDLFIASSATVFTGLSVLLAEFSIVSTVLEIVTFVQEVFNAREKYPNNSLIQALTKLFDYSRTMSATATDSTADIPVSEAEAAEIVEEVKKEVETVQKERDAAGIVDFTINLLNNVFGGLSQKASPEEIREFKQFLYHLAEQIANAAGEGQFGTGQKISPAEEKVLQTLKATLGV